MSRFEPAGPLPRGVTLLEASAGTGKTYGITSLVLRLVVEERLRLDQVLVVTFTEPATAELRDRVRIRMRAAVEALEAEGGATGPDHVDEVLAHLVRRAGERGSAAEDARWLRAQLEAFDQAAISTIHGFCARVLREHAFECGAEFDAELLADARPLLDEIVHDFWAREVASRPARAVAQLVALGLDVRSLAALAAQVTADVDAVVVPAEGGAEWEAAEDAFVIARNEVAHAWRHHGGAVRALIGSSSDVLNGNKYRVASFDRWFGEMDAWAAEPGREVPEEHFRRFSRSRLAEGVKKGKTPPAHPFFDDCERLLEALAEAGALRTRAFEAELVRVRHALVRYAREEFARRKRARRVQTYDDLLHLVRDALRDARRGPALAEALRARFDSALIDEFQDTDGAQWEIFRRVFADGGRRLVLIGDPKQAIYSFRGADIHAYLDAKSVAAETLSLAVNRRADLPLVQAVNALYGRAAHPFAIDGVGFVPVDAHHRAPRLRGGEAAPLVLRVVAREAPPLMAKGFLRDRVAALVADDVVRSLKAGLEVQERDGRWRPVVPRDLAVLVRKNRQALDVQRALRRAGVPGVVYGASSVFESDEARELETVLAALLEPSSMRLLRAALATDLLGLAAAAEQGLDGGAGDAIARLDEDERRWDAWLDRARAWSLCWAQRGVMPALRAMMDELRVAERLLALEDGERRVTNLRHVAELLHVTAVDGSLEPPALLDWLRAQRDEAELASDAAQMRLESDEDAVQIVTMHRAKGLEYPLVWCPYLWESPFRAEPPSFVYHDGAGRRVDIAPHDGRAANLARLREDEYAEELRLQYVALTRARHRCTVFWGAAKDCGSSPLAGLLFGASGGDVAARLAATVERVEGASDAELAGLLGDVAGVEAAGEPAALRWRPSRADAALLEARRWTRPAPLDGAWRVGSFTALTRDAAPADEGAPEALRDARDGAAGAGVHADAVPLDQFPSSARAGIFVHDVFERHDPAMRESLDQLVRERMRAYGFDADAWGARVAAALASAMEAPLLDGAGAFRLADLRAAERLTELRFEFPVHGGLRAREGALSPATLAAAFRDHPGGAVPASYAAHVARLRFPELRGFLTGAMDLAGRHGGRWWLVDYKSNHLGAAPLDYAPAALREEMAQSHYYLQYHLYLVALHRYLGWRVPGYDYERDVGGAFYLFVRGMDRERGPATGVFHDRPPLARIEALERALGLAGVGR